MHYLRQHHDLPERRACRLVALDRSSARSRSRRASSGALRQRLRERAHQRPRFGYRRLTVLLQREGQRVNHKRVYRLYREEGLVVRRQRRKRLAATDRAPLAAPHRAGQHWAMDFMNDTLATGRSFGTLNIVDTYTRAGLAIEVDWSLPGARVTRVLEQLSAQVGRPERIVVDNGPEFAGKVLDAWAYQQAIHLHFIDPGQCRMRISKVSMVSSAMSA